MVPDNRRVLRMLCKALLLISLPLAGFAWALPGNPTMMWVAGALTMLSLIVAFGAEYLASSTENDIHQLTQRLAKDGKRRADEMAAREEKLRQFDRIVALLTEQNHTLRARIISVQVEMQRKRESLLQAAADSLAQEDIPQDLRPSYIARAN